LAAGNIFKELWGDMKPIEITRKKITDCQMPFDFTHIGKWCFVYNSYFYGFFETEQEAISGIKNFNFNEYVERTRYIFTLRDAIA